MNRLFELGRWDLLEQSLQKAFMQDENDARTAFRLGNLLGLQGRWPEAAKHFEKAAAQTWRRPACLNNLGVAQAFAKKARPALYNLLTAMRENPRFGPPAYNLGILVQYLSRDGEVPPILFEFGVLEGRKSTSEEIQKIFLQAAKSDVPTWSAASSLLDAPCYLWFDDLASGFGFEDTWIDANRQEGERYKQEGLNHLEAEEWKDAIAAFDRAATIHEPMEANVSEHRRRAGIRLAQQHRKKAREMQAQRNYAGASATLRSFSQFADSLEDQKLAEELLRSNVLELCDDIRRLEASEDWPQLRHLTKMARDRVEELARLDVSQDPETPTNESEGEEEPSTEATPESPSDEGDPESKTRIATQRAETGSPIPEEEAKEAQEGAFQKPIEDETTSSYWYIAGRRTFSANPGAYVRGVCRGAWEGQLQYFLELDPPQFDAARDMLEISEIRWFAEDELPGWRHRVNEAQVEHFFEQATGAGLEDAEKRQRLYRTREGAIEAGEQAMVNRIDRRITETIGHAKQEDACREIDELLEKHEYLEALEKASEALAQTPEHQRLQSLRDIAVQRLRDRVENALRSKLWQKATDLAREVLEVLPDDKAMQEMGVEAQLKWRDELLDRARIDLGGGKIDRAREYCSAAVDIDSTHRETQELRRQIELKAVDRDAADEAYTLALVEIEDARGKNAPREAKQSLLELRRLDPTFKNLQTRSAQDWLLHALVHLGRSRLVDTESFDETTEDIEWILNIDSDFPPALELREDLRRRNDDSTYRKNVRKRAVKYLEQARDALEREGDDPLEALEALDQVRRLAPEQFADDIVAYREHALRLIWWEIKHIAQGDADFEDEEVRTKLGQYRAALRRWAAQEDISKVEKVYRKEVLEPKKNRQLDEQVEQIENTVREQPSPLEALKTLHQQVLTEERQDVLKKRLAKLRALRQECYAQLRFFGRLRARAFEFNQGVPSLTSKKGPQ